MKYQPNPEVMARLRVAERQIESLMYLLYKDASYQKEPTREEVIITAMSLNNLGHVLATTAGELIDDARDWLDIDSTPADEGIKAARRDGDLHLTMED